MVLVLWPRPDVLSVEIWAWGSKPWGGGWSRTAYDGDAAGCRRGTRQCETADGRAQSGSAGVSAGVEFEKTIQRSLSSDCPGGCWWRRLGIFIIHVLGGRSLLQVCTQWGGPQSSAQESVLVRRRGRPAFARLPLGRRVHHVGVLQECHNCMSPSTVEQSLCEEPSLWCLSSLSKAAERKHACEFASGRDRFLLDVRGNLERVLRYVM
ncbi:hypothetical protein M011DRAFT_310052 [Sporormia fimetaria CBS 119925]|uniref:Uncharacterized protein n=1 Tax=Sporormia fimetaria CBS 119925 TaxID=1340428 RepID=A0A6A6VIF8_9PLEO|nr:hypothetical protein M011DRAFT_310052 [Sporormia fimetaria CBS 119925]